MISGFRLKIIRRALSGLADKPRFPSSIGIIGLQNRNRCLKLTEFELTSPSDTALFFPGLFAGANSASRPSVLGGFQQLLQILLPHRRRGISAVATRLVGDRNRHEPAFLRSLDLPLGDS